MGVKTANRSTIYLKGSTKIIVEFFEFAINSILYQRGIYFSEDFKFVKKYGVTLVMTIDDSLKLYLKRLLPQVESWLMAGKIQKLVLAILDLDSRETLERWQFDIQVIDDNDSSKGSASAKKKEKTEKQIQTEIREIIRQITSSITFLPTLTDKCTFNILAYTDRDAEVPIEWGDSDPHIIENAEQVRLRSFSTNYHRVDAMVSYKLDEDL
ncbi:1399_t:CDS:2 [Acaulospora morrowiae]|uniref:1399_t:CDS:1 n=1 Tax=Acaulospora morrowiae TaxID=94023 RepID=A0A9N8ZJU8_9GLOM|nr:1399_t:CDS:2 [Acaulospora morrowiae]